MRRYLRSIIYTGVVGTFLLGFATYLWADYTILDSSSVTRTFFSFTCFTTKTCAASVPMNSAGTEIFNSANPALIILRDAAGNARGANVNASNQLSVSVDGTNAVTQSTSPWVVNTTQIAGTALGATAVVNYGTTPAAVAVPGVNAFVTNTNSNGANTAANSSPVVVASDQKGPCTSKKTFNQTASTDLVTSTNKLWICGIVIISSSQQEVSFVEGTTTTTPCDTSAVAVIGATTADSTHGLALPANGGWTNTAAVPWINTTVTANHLCLLQSSTGLVSGVITYMDHT